MNQKLINILIDLGVFIIKIIIVLSMIVFVFGSYAVEINRGTTYEIIEPDTLKEIEQKASQFNWQGIKDNPNIEQKWVSLPIAKQNQTYRHTIITTLPFEVKDNKGNIIYPKGYQFNPLDYTTLPSRLVVIANACHLQAIKPSVSNSDIILIANNEPISFIKDHSRRAFILTPQAAKQLSVKQIPATINQVGNQLQINEYKPVRCQS